MQRPSEVCLKRWLRNLSWRRCLKWVKHIYKPVQADGQFGDDYRPVRLKKLVRGFECHNNWGLGPILDKALMPELLKLQDIDEHRGKPVLVFCPTRKSRPTLTVAELTDARLSNYGRLYVPNLRSSAKRSWQATLGPSHHASSALDAMILSLTPQRSQRRTDPRGPDPA